MIGGELINTKFSNSKRCHIITIDLNQQLERFWSIEEILLHYIIKSVYLHHKRSKEKISFYAR